MAGPYPLPTLAAVIDATGIHAPSFADVLASKQAQYAGIFGSDVVLEASTQDQQSIAAESQAVVDANAALVACYNSFRPGGAVGAGLSSIVKINGLRRLVASNSTAAIQIVGTAGTIITNGIVGDGTYQWTLPATVTIPVGGSITVTATCTTIGAISAPAGTINQIVTPQRGWQTAVSTSDAAIGAPVEKDPVLYQRQTVSTALPALTPLETIVANLENLSGVTAVKSYENDTLSTDTNGLPSGAISLVVEGGDAVAIATTIAASKTPGVPTYGTTSEIIIDANGVPNHIKFFIPSQLVIDVTVTIAPQAGYVSPTGTLIQSQITAYLNSLGINGTDGFVFYSKLFSPANDTGSVANTYNVTGIVFGVHGTTLGTSDVAVPFNSVVTAGAVVVNA